MIDGDSISPVMLPTNGNAFIDGDDRIMSRAEAKERIGMEEQWN